jgi:hypothetical protein
MKGLDFAAVAPGDHAVDDEDEEEEEEVEDEEEEEEVFTESEEVSSESAEEDEEEEEESSEEDEGEEEDEEDEKHVPDVKPKTVNKEPVKPQEEIAGFVKKSGLANTEYAGINVGTFRPLRHPMHDI